MEPPARRKDGERCRQTPAAPPDLPSLQHSVWNEIVPQTPHFPRGVSKSSVKRKTPPFARPSWTEDQIGHRSLAGI